MQPTSQISFLNEVAGEDKKVMNLFCIYDEIVSIYVCMNCIVDFVTFYLFTLYDSSCKFWHQQCINESVNGYYFNICLSCFSVYILRL